LLIADRRLLIDGLPIVDCRFADLPDCRLVNGDFDIAVVSV
jgi:hypothetical protein